jgi:hypothetical protein
MRNLQLSVVCGCEYIKSGIRNDNEAIDFRSVYVWNTFSYLPKRVHAVFESLCRRLENGHGTRTTLDHYRSHVYTRSTENRSKSVHRHLASASAAAAADASVSPSDAKSPKQFPAVYCSGCAKRLHFAAAEKWNKVDPVSSPQHHRTDHVADGLLVANGTNDRATATRNKHDSKAVAAQSTCHRWKEMKPISHYYRKHRKRELNHNRAMQQVAEWIETTGDGSGNVEIGEFHRSTRRSSHGLTRHEQYVNGDDQCQRHEHYHHHYHYHFNVNDTDGKI